MSRSFPEPFLVAMKQRLGQEFASWQSAMEETPPISIRTNPLKIATKLDLSEVPWTSNGYYLPRRPLFALDPAWHAGAYYVQEASSMMIEAAIPDELMKAPVIALDLCAAPGGKSTHLSEILHPHSLIVSNEVIKQRSRILEENLTRWGNGNSMITQLDPSVIGKNSEFFDLILVDAPCSGEGMFRKDPEAVHEWSSDHVVLCANRQQRILQDIWPALKPGGFLVYSTCTWNQEEDEKQISRLLAETNAEVVTFQVEDEWGMTLIGGAQASGYLSLPHKAKGEGFFISLLRKPGNREKQSFRKVKKLNLASRKQREMVQHLIPDEWSLFEHHGGIFGLPSQAVDPSEYLINSIPIISLGVELGEIKGKDFRPGADSAFWSYLNHTDYTKVPLSIENALRFLRRDPIPGITQRGWLLMTYQDIPLGWAKGLGNRINNYYPQGWRLRMEIPKNLELFSLLNHSIA